MGNAGPLTKAAADVVLEGSNDEDAVARAIERYVLQPRGVAEFESAVIHIGL